MVERVEEKLLLPAERGLEDAVVPKTAKMREQMVRLHLVLFLKDRDVRRIDSETVDSLQGHFVESARRRPGAPLKSPSERYG